tara:strand:+ start:173 stop:433 length:261 start_codon:yes stop_codon:yes gene_type:complete
MKNITEFNKASIYYQGLKSAINDIKKNKEILDTINSNDYFYFNIYTFHASSSFQLFKITAENYLTNNEHKKNKYTKNEILHIISNN